ncbi:MAG: 50S ribosomal L9 C-terminal domain-containing protein, partial [Pseudomonadota bacterium]
KQVVLDRPIKELGLHDMRVVLHPEVAATITVNVARSAEEAELQASGKSIQDLRAEEDAEAQFDIEELFDEVGAAALDTDEELPRRDDGPILDTDSEAEDQPEV